MRKIVFLLLCSTIFSEVTQAQIREIPSFVIEAFKEQYPGVEEYEVKDMLVKIVFYFNDGEDKMIASYSNKGTWKVTEKEWEFSKLSVSVKEGFEKSMYADRTVEEAAILYLPGDVEQYRLKVKKNDFEKKYIYFNKKGPNVKGVFNPIKFFKL